MSDRRKTAVDAAEMAVLTPLAELHLHSGRGIGDLFAVLKRAIVQAAINKAEKAGERGPLSQSRIAAETGLARQDIAAILEQRPGDPPTIRRGRARAERVLQAWWHDPQYHNDEGRPAPLPFRGPIPSFVTLAKEYSGTARAQPILEELLRTKAIRELKNGRYQAVRMTCSNLSWEPEAIEELGLQARTLLDTLLNNLDQPQAAQFVRHLVSVPIDPRYAPVLLRDLTAEGALFMENAVDRLSRPPYTVEEGSASARQFYVGIQVLEKPLTSRVSARSPLSSRNRPRPKPRIPRE